MPAAFLRFVHVLVLFLLPLCVGAVWSVAAQLSGLDLSALALVVAAVTLFLRGQLAFLGRASRILLHVLACAAGILYAQVLIVSIAVAGPFGYGLFETLQRMGGAMALSLVAVRSDAGDRMAYLVALTLAGLIGSLRPRLLRPRSVP